MKKHVSILLGLMVIFSSLFTSCNNEDELDPNICKITVNSEGNGTVAITDYIGTSVNVLIGNIVEVVATPDDGWAFIGWYISGTEAPASTDAAFTFTTSESVTLTAKFAKLSDIIIRSEGNGSVAFKDSKGNSIAVLPGTEVTVLATPDEYCNFAGWFVDNEGNPISTDTEYTFIANKNITLTAKFNEPPFGNEEIGEATYTISELKRKYFSTINSNSVQEIFEDIIIEGVVVANDESGNIYKQIIINDSTGAIVVWIDDVKLYLKHARGQRVRLNCKGLHIGGYGKMAIICAEDDFYDATIRLNKYIYSHHVRIIGHPDLTQPEMQPETIDDTFFTNANKNNLAKFVRLEGVEIVEADGTATWAPEELQYNNVVERKIKMGKTNIVLRMSTYADFANEAIPDGELNINGVMTRYNDYWQFVISSTADIEPANE